MTDIATINQQVAATRHRWAEIDRVAGDVASFIEWSAERAEYARRAMKLMGITEDDQYFA